MLVGLLLLLQLLVPAVDLLQVDLQPLQLLVGLQHLGARGVQHSLVLLRQQAVLLLVPVVLCAKVCDFLRCFRRNDVDRVLAVGYQLQVGCLDLKQLPAQMVDSLIAVYQLLAQVVKGGRSAGQLVHQRHHFVVLGGQLLLDSLFPNQCLQLSLAVGLADTGVTLAN